MYPALVAEVRTLALTPGDDAIRISAIDALVDARGTDAAEVLSEIVRGAGSLTVRAEAALALQSLDTGVTAQIVKRTADAISEDRTIGALFKKDVPSNVV